MRRKQYLLDTTSPRTPYRVGTKFITTMGIVQRGRIVRRTDLPHGVMEELWRRSFPSKPYIPVRFESGEYSYMSRGFIKLLLDNPPAS